MKVSRAVSCALVALCLTGTTYGAASSLTLFHNNDGESKLLGSAGFGGFDYFLGELDAARTAAAASRDVLTVSSGDNILAGLAWNASENRVSNPAGASNAQNYYDALALTAAQYDAITIGNHEFDFGPAVLDDFIGGYRAAGGAAPFLSANLDFSADAGLNSRVGSGHIAPSTTVVGGVSGQKYGIIGVTTPRIQTISSGSPVEPIDGATDGNTSGLDLQDIADAVNAQVTALQGNGVDRIILSGHLQGLNEDEALVSLISGVDVIIAGGGDELLKNNDDALTLDPFQPNISDEYPEYPAISTDTDLDGRNVPIVTTAGEYRYVGQLEVDFDANGNVIAAGGLTFDVNGQVNGGSRNGDPILVDPDTSTNQATGVFNGIDIQNDIMNPLAADVAALEATVVGNSAVDLNHLRDGGVRTEETNIGNAIADAFVWQADQIVELTTGRTVGVTNGGGIRGDTITPAGDLTAGDAIDILPFANSVVVIEDIDVADLISALEHAVSNVENVDGRFLQVSGLEFVYDIKAPVGDRLVSVELEDGTVLYDIDLGGQQDFGVLDLVTNSFTAGGGDDFDEFAAYFATDVSVNYGDAFVNYIQNALGGTITAADYPVGGEGRITQIPEPASIALLGLGGLALLRRRSA